MPKEGVYTEAKSGKKINKVKVDIVAENGRRWLRVNTTKESRLVTEFRAIEAFGYESEDEDVSDAATRRLPMDKYLDNTVYESGRFLSLAADKFQAENGGDRPIIQLRLSRLGHGENEIQDERIKHTLTRLTDLGIKVSFAPEASSIQLVPEPAPPSGFYIPSQINLDLSMLIAIVTDISHAPLPPTREAVDELFRPQAERSWRRQMEKNPNLPDESLEHCRALAEQTRHEMDHGLIENIYQHLRSSPDADSAHFWTTNEAKTRLLAIIEKIGGEDELRRARAMFSLEHEAPELFWLNSRIPVEHRPKIIPILILPDEEPLGTANLSMFQRQVMTTCNAILSRPLRPEIKSNHPDKSIQAPMRFAARLSMHTIQSLLLGAQSGMLTVTSNKTSVKHLLREMRGFSLPSALHSTAETHATSPLAILVLEPRSLSQSMRIDYASNS